MMRGMAFFCALRCAPAGRWLLVVVLTRLTRTKLQSFVLTELQMAEDGYQQ